MANIAHSLGSGDAALVGHTSNHATVSPLHNFELAYRPFHGYFAVIWCSFAIIFNVLTVILLQHRSMKSTTNFLLCWTSLLQLILCTLYLAFASLFYVSELRISPNALPHEAAVILYIYVILSTFANTALMWCTVTVAGFRLICIIFPHRPELCTTRRARFAVALIFISAAFCTIPAMLAHEVKLNPAGESAITPTPTPTSNNENNSTSSPTVSKSELMVYTVEVKAGAYGKLVFWINAILCKLVPSVLLSVISFMLVRRMKSVDRRRMTLISRSSVSEHQPALDQQQQQQQQQPDSRNRRTQRTTSLLATIAILFSVVYLPQSALEILGAFSEEIKLGFYTHIGDVLDELSLINNGVTFILHCSMSQQFRTTLMVVIITPILQLTVKRDHIADKRRSESSVRRRSNSKSDQITNTTTNQKSACDY